ncbi:GNAT family N-acetyltransferase [Streptomyces sp. NPDC000410]|uniref:GNAT family N-acetyltransferase n=1 Tax=Streptomyces sp. NPDC000410 TaxID=3154254 RepID=UPI0033208BE1
MAAAHEAPEFVQITRPGEVTPDLRRQLIDCWAAVANTGGAVIARSFPMPPVSARHVGPEVDRLAGELDPERGRMIVATVREAVAGWLIVRREPHPLVAHRGVVNHVMTHPRVRGHGVGAALMRRASDVARAEMGLEQLELAARGGVGLEDFYAKLGWVEIGRCPRALRVAPGDDRDEILMILTLPAPGPERSAPGPEHPHHVPERSAPGPGHPGRRPKARG